MGLQKFSLEHQRHTITLRINILGSAILFSSSTMMDYNKENIRSHEVRFSREHHREDNQQNRISKFVELVARIYYIKFELNPTKFSHLIIKQKTKNPFSLSIFSFLYSSTLAAAISPISHCPFFLFLLLILLLHVRLPQEALLHFFFVWFKETTWANAH